MNRLIAVFAGVGLILASTHTLSAGIASAPETYSREKNGGSLMQQPLTILAWDYQSKLGVLTKAAKSPLVRPNASIRSLGPASRVRGTAARGSFSPASRHRGIDQTGPSNLPGSTNANIPGSSPGGPNSVGGLTGQRGAPGLPGGPNSVGGLTGPNGPQIPSSPGSLGGRTGSNGSGLLGSAGSVGRSGQIGPRMPGDGDQFPGGELSAGQNVIEYLNRKDGIETPQNPTPQLSPPAASRHSCKINCIDAASFYGPGHPLSDFRCQGDMFGQHTSTTEVFLCNYICGGKVVETGEDSSHHPWMICIERDKCPKLEAKIQEVGPLGRPSVCSWYDKDNSNDRQMFDKIRCPQGTKWHKWDKFDRDAAIQQYADAQESGLFSDLPLLADFELGACLPDWMEP